MAFRLLFLYSLACIGTLTLARLLFSTSRVVYRLFLRRSSLPRYIKPDANGGSSWALITGASDGIGLALAYELCARGANVIIHGRNADKLAKVRAELLAAYPERKIETVVADAGQADTQGAVAKVVKTIQNLPDGGRLRILINNVGGSKYWAGRSGPIFHRFSDLQLADVDALVNVNVRFGTVLTAAVWPILTADDTPSLIINFSSMAGINPLPYMVVYCAAKSYILAFSETLQDEAKTEGKNVEVLGLLIGDVDTPGAPKEEKAGVLVIEPPAFARAALNAVGCGEVTVAPGLNDWLTTLMIGMTPRSAMRSAMKDLFERLDKKQKTM